MKIVERVKQIRWLFFIIRVRTNIGKMIFEKIWKRIWLDENYSNSNDLDKIVAHYEIFDHCSSDFLLTFCFIPIGTVRIIRQDVKGLPVLNDFETTPSWKGKVVEITLLTLKKEWRTSPASLFLFREGYWEALRQKAEGVVIAADRRLFRTLRLVGLPFDKIGESKFYEGSITIPSFIPLERVPGTIKDRKFFLR